MFDAFPYKSWDGVTGDFWAFGGANSTGTYVLTALGVLLMIASLIGFVQQESRRLERQAERLKRSGVAARMHVMSTTTTE